MKAAMAGGKSRKKKWAKGKAMGHLMWTEIKMLSVERVTVVGFEFAEIDLVSF